MITIEGTVSKAMLAEKAGAIFDRDYYFNPEVRFETDEKCRKWIENNLSHLNVFRGESNLAFLEHGGSPKLLIGGIQPNMILGMLLGAKFVAYPDKDADIEVTGEVRDRFDDLPDPKSLLEHELIELFDSQLQKHSADTSRAVIPPFFWHQGGMAAVHGAVTTAGKLYGETIYMDMIADPKKCRRILDWIMEAYICLVEHFARYYPFEIASIHTGGCSGCILGKDQFDEYIITTASRLGRAFPSLRFHSCGGTSHLLGSISRIANLSTIDVGGETDISEVRRVFGNRFPVSIAPMPQDMQSGSVEPVLNWARNVLKSNAGGPLKMIYHIEPDYNLETIIALEALVKNGDSR